MFAAVNQAGLGDGGNLNPCAVIVVGARVDLLVLEAAIAVISMTKSFTVYM
jgi:hypothetical protein